MNAPRHLRVYVVDFIRNFMAGTNPIVQSGVDGIRTRAIGEMSSS